MNKTITCFGWYWPSSESDQHFKENALQIWYAYVVVKGLIYIDMFKTCVKKQTVSVQLI
jgi:hypothetical protein